MNSRLITKSTLALSILCLALQTTSISAFNFDFVNGVIHNSYGAELEQLSAHDEQRVREILTTMGINEKVKYIIFITQPEDYWDGWNVRSAGAKYDAKSDEYALFIDKNTFETLPPDQFIFVIGREAAHIALEHLTHNAKLLNHGENIKYSISPWILDQQAYAADTLAATKLNAVKGGIAFYGQYFRDPKPIVDARVITRCCNLLILFIQQNQK